MDLFQRRFLILGVHWLWSLNMEDIQGCSWHLWFTWETARIIFCALTASYEGIRARLLSVGFPHVSCLFLHCSLCFLMTIRLESNERERVFAYCQSFCFDYFKVSNHPVSGAQETCPCGGLAVSLSLLRLGFEGRRTGYTPWVDTGYVSLRIHPPRWWLCPWAALARICKCLWLSYFWCLRWILSTKPLHVNSVHILTYSILTTQRGRYYYYYHSTCEYPVHTHWNQGLI